MKRLLSLGIALLAGVTQLAFADDVPLTNWLVPSKTGGKSGPALAADATSPIPFIGLPPCRLVDTRGNGAPFQGGAYGGGEVRSYDFAGTCGIPQLAAALSLNVTVTQAAGGGFITVWPTGGAMPTVSTVNYVAGQTIANAAVVLTSGSQASVSFVAGVSGTHLVVDVNGYFSDRPGSPANFFQIINNSSNLSLRTLNASTSCAGSCGIYATILSGTDGASAIAGESLSSSGRGIGVVGTTQGGGTGFSSGNAAGVAGRASSGAAHGVRGETSSASAFSAGVAGFASAAGAGAGFFQNTGIAGSVNTQLATQIASLKFGVFTNGDVSCNTLTANSKSFIAPHPEDASKEIVYVSVEAPQADIYFRGTAKLVDGVARIPVPEHFRLSARPGSYMTTLTPATPNPIPLGIESEGPDGIVVRGRSDVRFHYVVYAERDAFKDHDPTPANVHFAPDALSRRDPTNDLPESYREILVKNGTLNPDGTFNRETAARLGWTIPAEAMR